MTHATHLPQVLPRAGDIPARGIGCRVQTLFVPPLESSTAVAMNGKIQLLYMFWEHQYCWAAHATETLPLDGILLISVTNISESAWWAPASVILQNFLSDVDGKKYIIVQM